MVFKIICDVRLQCKGFVTTGDFLKRKEVQYTKTQIEISCVNELFGGAYIHLGCTLHCSHSPHPFAFTAFRLTASFVLKKVLSLKGYRIEEVDLLIQNFFCITLFPWHFINLAFTVLQPLADAEGKRSGAGKGELREEGLRGVRDGCKCGIM